MLRLARRLAYRALGHLPFRAKLLVNRAVNSTFLVGMLAVVRNPEGDVLILRHTYRPSIPHGVPSGWLKRDESLPEAMRREIAEETGFDVDFLRVLLVESCERPTRLDVWLEYAFRDGQFRASAEVSEARFYALDALPPLLPAQREFLASLWR
jgi:8-oxo-dGTP diphosphatase